MRKFLKDIIDGKTSWGETGFLEGLKDDAYYYTKYNYNIVADYILKHDPDDLIVFGKHDITDIIFPIIRRIVNYKNWYNNRLEPNYVKIEDPEKFVNYVKQLWRELDSEVLQLKLEREKHGFSIDYEAEMCARISENINYILKKDDGEE